MAQRRTSEPKDSGIKSPARKPASTPEGREAQLIALADALAEKQLREGTASSQVITHYLKLGSTRERLEQVRMEHEIEMLKAKSEAIASQGRVEELYKSALDAMRTYSGTEQPRRDYDD